MDAIIKLLQKIYKYVSNYPSTNNKGKTTVIEASLSKTNIGLPADTLLPTTIEVSGDNTLVVFYGQEQILDIMSVPDSVSFIRKFFSKKILEEKMKYQQPEVEQTPQQVVYGLDQNEKNRLVEATRKYLLPHRVKPIKPVKSINPAKPIKPVRQINPWRSIKPKN